MARTMIFAVISIVALSGMPVHAQNPGDVLEGIGRGLNYNRDTRRDEEWRQRERERAYQEDQRRLDADQRRLDAERRALRDQRRLDERGGYGPSYGPPR